MDEGSGKETRKRGDEVACNRTGDGSARVGLGRRLGGVERCGSGARWGVGAMSLLDERASGEYRLEALGVPSGKSQGGSAAWA